MVFWKRTIGIQITLAYFAESGCRNSSVLNSFRKRAIGIEILISFAYFLQSGCRNSIVFGWFKENYWYTVFLCLFSTVRPQKQ